MERNRARWLTRFLLLSIGAPSLSLLIYLGAASGQASFNEREIRTQPSDLEQSDVRTLDFVFKDPRLIKASYPGRGTRVFWYLWYRVVNRTGQPVAFKPDFEIVTYDPPATYGDEVLPMVQDAIRKIEDPTGYLELKNSVEISNFDIPASKPANESFPKAVNGVAIWDASPADLKTRDPNVKDLADATRFSIYIRGLSNGSVQVDPLVAGQPPVTRFKTLKLDFSRAADRTSTDSRDIRFVGFEWVYRAADYKMPAEKK